MKNDTTFSDAIFVFFALVVAIVPAAADPGTDFFTAVPAIHLSDIVEKASSYDGTIVAIEGEIVGDVMARGDHSWINILDSGTAVGIWADNDRLPEIAYLGNYDAIGDRVYITGIMHRACPEHGGDLDIHAETIVLVKKGIPISHPLDLTRLCAAIAFSLSGILLAVLWRKRGRREKSS